MSWLHAVGLLSAGFIAGGTFQKLLWKALRTDARSLLARARAHEERALTLFDTATKLATEAAQRNKQVYDLIRDFAGALGFEEPVPQTKDELQ